MKKHYVLLVLAVTLLSLPLGAMATQQKQDVLTVYAYDSFVSEWGPGPLVIPAFEQKTGIKVELISAGHGGELLSRLLLEKNRPVADVVIGIEGDLLQEVLASSLFLPYRPPAMDQVPQFLHIDTTYALVPFNYGNYAFVYDSQKISTPPTTLHDLLDPKWKKSLILIDPRTSNVGMGLLHWSIAVYGAEFTTFWQELKPNILTISDGWSSAYGLFTEGEAPLVISYTTSPIYHLIYEHSDRYKALAFDEGNMAVIETAGILASTSKVKEAQQFIDFLLTEAQADIAVANVMYPVNSLTVLPSAFSQLPVVKHSLMLSQQELAANRQKWLNQWVEVMSR